MKVIDDLVPYLGVINEKKKRVVFRKFTENDNPLCYLELDCNTLETKVLRSMEVRASKKDFQKVIQGTKYSFLISSSIQNSNILLGGVSKVYSEFVLTADLCPSSKRLNYDLISTLLAKKISPVYLCISGMWIQNHKNEFEYLKSLEGIQIIWVNHSYYHRFEISNKKRNFMLLKGTNINSEVLNTEKLLLENEIIPSVFFRFPGLRTNKRLSKSLISYGLIPLGANSWLAKGQEFSSGSIILVHANGNELEGVSMLNECLNTGILTPTFI